MTTRPRSHIVGDLAIAKVIDIFTQVGWTCEKISQDYGEDLIVRIFENDAATPKHFFVQSKSTDKIDRFLNKRGIYRFPFRSAHLEQWKLFHQPVIVTLYDASSGNVYWQAVQEYIDNLLPKSRKRLRSLIFSNNRILSRDSAILISNIVTERYEYFKSGEAGARILEEELYAHYGLKIEYSPHGLIV